MVRNDDRYRVALSPTMSAVYRGEDDLSEWTDEELQRGKRKVGGRFHGPDPKVLPRAIADELNRRTFEQAYSIVRDDVEDAVRLWGDIVRNPDADLALRLEASKEIANRILGKPTDRAQVELAIKRDPWQDALVTALVGSVEQAAEVIDVEPVEPDDEGIDWDNPDH